MSDGDSEAEQRETPVLPKSHLPVDQVLRGIALALTSVVVAGGSIGLLRRLGLAGLPLVSLGGGISCLSAWAAVIHLTGGERFDDHPQL